MKKSIFNLIIVLSFFSSGEIWANPTKTQNSPLQKDYFFFQNDHSQVMVDWIAQEKSSLNVIIQSLGTYFKKAADNKDSLQDQLLLAAGALQSWFSGVAKSVHPDLNANTEIGFFPRSDAKHFRSNAEASMEQIKALLKKKKEYRSYSDDQLTDLAVEKMPIGYDSQVHNVDDFILTNPWSSSQIQIVAGDAVLVSVGGRLRVTMSLVLSLPNVDQSLQANLSGYALLDHLIIPSSNDGHSPVYAVLNLDFVTSPKDFKISRDGDVELPLSHAYLQVDFSNDVKVAMGNKVNLQDHRMVTFSPLRSGGGFENPALTDAYTPTERLPYLRAKNILPTGQIWKPLANILGHDGIFDFGFVNFYGFEMDLVNLQALSLSGRLEFYNRKSAYNSNGSASAERGKCLTFQDKDHCLGWSIKPGDYLDRYFVGLINKYLDGEKQQYRAKMKQKISELAAIVNGSYQAYKTHRESGGNYSQFSENMLKDLCQDGTLSASDEQCQAINSGRDR